MTLVKSKRIRAKKEHVCNCCGDRIKSGDLYQRTTYFNDVFYDWIEHIECSKVLDHFYKDMDPNGDGIRMDRFAEYIEGIFEQHFRRRKNLSLRPKVLMLYDKLVKEEQ